MGVQQTLKSFPFSFSFFNSIIHLFNSMTITCRYSNVTQYTLTAKNELEYKTRKQIGFFIYRETRTNEKSKFYLSLSDLFCGRCSKKHAENVLSHINSYPRKPKTRFICMKSCYMINSFNLWLKYAWHLESEMLQKSMTTTKGYCGNISLENKGARKPTDSIIIALKRYWISSFLFFHIFWTSFSQHSDWCEFDMIFHFLNFIN